MAGIARIRNKRHTPEPTSSGSYRFPYDAGGCMQNKMTRGELRVIADTDHVQCGDAAAMANMLLAAMDV